MSSSFYTSGISSSHHASFQFDLLTPPSHLFLYFVISNLGILGFRCSPANPNCCSAIVLGSAQSDVGVTKNQRPYNSSESVGCWLLNGMSVYHTFIYQCFTWICLITKHFHLWLKGNSIVWFQQWLKFYRILSATAWGPPRMPFKLTLSCHSDSTFIHWEF